MPPITLFKQRAFSLIELMTVVSILGIIAAFGFPTINNTIQSTKITMYANSMIGGIALAKQAALKEDKPTILCPSIDTATCSSLASDLRNGWLVYVDDNNNNTFDISEKVIGSELSGLSTSIRIVENLGTRAFTARFFPQQDNFLSSSDDLTVSFCYSGIFPVVFNYSSLKKRGTVKTDRSAKCSG